MIQSNTLRIGNLVKYKWEIKPILELREKHCFLEGLMFPIGYEKLEPIQITEDILVRMGFEKTTDLGDQIYFEMQDKPHINFGFGVCFDHEDLQFYQYRLDRGNVLIHDEPYFQYVHNLQNLVSNLYGRELTLTDL